MGKTWTLVSRAQADITKYHTDWVVYTIEICFLQVEKPKIEVLTDPVPGGREGE